MSYKVEIYEGTEEYNDGPSLSLTEHQDNEYYQVMAIRKPCRFNEDYMVQSKDYVVEITWCKSSYDLISLVFKMLLPITRYQKLVSGEKEEVEEKLINFYLNALKTLKELESSFPA